MKKETREKISICYFLMGVVLQYVSPFFVHYGSLLWKVKIYNTFMEYCVVNVAFGEKAILCLMIYLGVSLLSLIALVLMVKRKRSYILISFGILSADLVFHIIWWYKEIYAYVGLGYKLLGCIIYIKILYDSYAKK